MIALLLLPGCELTELSQPWVVDRTRVLALQSEPAEPRPGDSVTFSSLTADPDGGIGAVTWLGCVIEEASSSFGCSPDYARIEELFAVDLESLTLEEQIAWYGELQDAGVLGFEPGPIPVSYTIPATLLDDQSEDEKLEGKNYMLTVSAIPERLLPEGGDSGLDFSGFDAELLGDEDEVEIGFKRMPVSLAPTPNANPVIVDLLAEDAGAIVDGQTLTLTHGQTYHFEVRLSEDSIQTYSYRSSEGVDEERVEEPYFSFYATAGSFDQTLALHPYGDFDYRAPVEPGEQSLWVVVRDRRGGMDWLSLTLEIR